MSDVATPALPIEKADSSVALPLLSDTFILSLILISLQVLDGFLTAFGVQQFGHGIEANIIIRNLMDYYGYVQALVMVKSLAILIVIALYRLAHSIEWLNDAVRCVIVIYICAAIIPWSAIILQRIF